MIISQLLVFFALSLELGGPYCATHVKGEFTNRRTQSPRTGNLEFKLDRCGNSSSSLQFRRLTRRD
jgi:hypothetical protein